MNKFVNLAAAMAVIAFPAVAENTTFTPEPMVTVVQCESEKILMLLKMMKKDLEEARADLEEVRGDREEQQLMDQPQE